MSKALHKLHRAGSWWFAGALLTVLTLAAILLLLHGEGQTSGRFTTFRWAPVRITWDGSSEPHLTVGTPTADHPARLALYDGGDRAGTLVLHDRQGTARYLFVATDDTLRLAAQPPVIDADGTVVGPPGS
jgi:hypothetical protein